MGKKQFKGNDGKGKDFKKDSRSGKSNGKPSKPYGKEDSSKDKGSKHWDGNMDAIVGNDISWWNKSPLYDLSTSIQYNRFAGYVHNVSDLADAGIAGTTPVKANLNNFQATGGVLTIEYYPTLGVANDANAPINQCFNSLYAKLVQATNSGNVGFQQADLALITLGTLSIVNMLAEAKRMLGLVNMYYRENSFYPAAVFAALGETRDIYSMRARRPEYVSRLQTAIMNFNALGIPSYIDLFKRGTQLGRNVYQDEDQLNSMPFVFKSKGYYVYDDTAGSLKFKKFDTTNVYNNQLDILLDSINEALEAFRNTSDLGLILGAVRRAFPEAALIRLDLPTYNDVTEPQYDRNVNWQLNNLFCVPDIDTDSLSVTQNVVGNYLQCSPYYDYPTDTQPDLISMSLSKRSMILNSYTKEIGNEFAMESTRMIPLTTIVETNDHIRLMVTSCGTELPCGIKLTVPVQTSENGMVTYAMIEVPQVFKLNETEVNMTDWINYLELSCRLAKFDTAPRLYTYTYSTEDGILPVYIGQTGNLSIYTTIASEQLAQMHLAALQSVYQLTLG